MSDLISYLIDVGIPMGIGAAAGQFLVKTLWKPIFQAQDQQRIADFNKKRDELLAEARKLGMTVQ